MKRSLVATALAVAVLASSPQAFAITDYYSTGPGAGTSDGLEDVWQQIYNGWGLTPGADADNDG